jgi:agmatine/peptidylarginine deiminase
MDFRRFNPVCPQKTRYGALFLNGAIAEWSSHTSTLIAFCHMTEQWNAVRG